MDGTTFVAAIIGVVALLLIFGKNGQAAASIVVQSEDTLTSQPNPDIRPMPMIAAPTFGVAHCGPDLHTCQPQISSVPVTADSIVNGVDLFKASGGITPTAAGGDVLFNSFTGSDGVVQYQYRRPNGDTYTTTTKNA